MRGTAKTDRRGRGGRESLKRSSISRRTNTNAFTADERRQQGPANSPSRQPAVAAEGALSHQGLAEDPARLAPGPSPIEERHLQGRQGRVEDKPRSWCHHAATCGPFLLFHQQQTSRPCCASASAQQQGFPRRPPCATRQALPGQPRPRPRASHRPERGVERVPVVDGEEREGGADAEAEGEPLGAPPLLLLVDEDVDLRGGGRERGRWVDEAVVSPQVESQEGSVEAKERRRAGVALGAATAEEQGNGRGRARCAGEEGVSSAPGPWISSSSGSCPPPPGAGGRAWGCRRAAPPVRPAAAAAARRRRAPSASTPAIAEPCQPLRGGRRPLPPLPGPGAPARCGARSPAQSAARSPALSALLARRRAPGRCARRRTDAHPRAARLLPSQLLLASAAAPARRQPPARQPGRGGRVRRRSGGRCRSRAWSAAWLPGSRIRSPLLRSTRNRSPPTQKRPRPPFPRCPRPPRAGAGVSCRRRPPRRRPPRHPPAAPLPAAAARRCQQPPRQEARRRG